MCGAQIRVADCCDEHQSMTEAQVQTERCSQVYYSAIIRVPDLLPRNIYMYVSTTKSIFETESSGQN
jgi:hypothetical protein